ncbi:hypothetical protein CQW23_24876 [Capsicum baccatum]|uniref:Alpha-L-arabinofuranosidase C-terminal domain-containing protein n=1 Tax=Capsicum baccatum TaxID=33114 RepID=A0A2G2VW28_CAPBA|nr:hypothetical protein CQW23_24876 [Capsicum baccatum]
MPDTLFGIFIEEMNHAGSGGLWAELVSNRGFESGGSSVPSLIKPWDIIGNDSSVIVSTDLSSCFDRNKVALRMENVEQGKSYKLVFYLRSDEPVNLSVALTGSNGLKKLATTTVLVANASNWTKVMVMLEAEGTDPKSRLELKSTTKGVMWFDQVSLMPLDTCNLYTFASEILSHFDDAPRSGPKAFISEYATKGDAGNGNLLAALAEAGFLIGVERTASAITWQNETDNDKYLRMKVVNIGNSTVTLSIDLSGLDSSLQSSGATKTILTSSDVMDENSFADPKKIAPVKTMLDKVCENMDVVLLPYSITSTDLLRL